MPLSKPLPPSPVLCSEATWSKRGTTVADVRTMTGTTYAAANSLVSRLVKLGILHEMTGYARNRRFRYAPYIALFNDTGGLQ